MNGINHSIYAVVTDKIPYYPRTISITYFNNSNNRIDGYLLFKELKYVKLLSWSKTLKEIDDNLLDFLISNYFHEEYVD